MTTINSLITTYAGPIASEAGIDPTEYQQTAAGLAELLRDTASGLGPSDQTAERLQDAARDLDAIHRLGDNGTKTQDLLGRVDSALYEVKTDLE